MSVAEVAVAEVKRLRPEPGDVIVIRVEGRIDFDLASQMSDQLRKTVPKGVQVLIADEGISDVQLHKSVAACTGEGKD